MSDGFCDGWHLARGTVIKESYVRSADGLEYRPVPNQQPPPGHAAKMAALRLETQAGDLAAAITPEETAEFVELLKRCLVKR